jgi:hypothetical protein
MLVIKETAILHNIKFLQIHFSFSKSKDLSKLKGSSKLNIIHVVLENIGVMLTDVQDVIFK